MIFFETERLTIKRLLPEDKPFFAELFTDQKVLELIPQKAFTDKEITDRFNNNLAIDLNDLKTKKCACGVFEKDNPDMIGLALFLINDNNDYELGYRLRQAYWKKGYGTETTKGMLEFYFNTLQAQKVTADVNIENVSSVKILNKFMTPVKEFFNPRDQCTDRRFEIYKKDWLEKNI